jgi:hypothetical protein
MGQQFARRERLSSPLFVSSVAWLLLEVVLGRVARTITSLPGRVCWEGRLVTRRVSTLVAPGLGPA